jgi:hypothetical protein
MPEFDYMHAIKPTEGYKWAHVLCSTFVGDLQWSDGQNLRVTEGIMSLKAIQFGRVRFAAESPCINQADHLVPRWL